MSILQAIVLGFVEGITEFLPISSTAHLMMTSEIFNVTQTEFLKSFEIVVQLGAIASVLFIFGRKLLENPHLIKKVIIGFIPTAVVGFVLYKFIRNYLITNLSIAAWSLIIGGIIMILVEYLYLKHRKDPGYEVDHLTNTQAFVIGVFQSIAVIPGVSRAAATIIPSLLFGASRKAAAEFSFMLAVPTIGAAAFYELFQNFGEINGNASVMIIGFVVSFLAALVSIKFLLSFVQKYSYVAFGVYRIVIAVIFLTFFI